MGKNILVTGGAGFIGSSVVDKLLDDGNNVAVVDNLSGGSRENLNPKAKFYKIDIQDPKISEIFQKEKPEIVFHFAAQIDVRKSVQSPVFDAGINILGSLNILENCRKFGAKRFIFASSGGAIYGDAKTLPTPEDCEEMPLSPYGIAKLSVEKYLNYYHEVFGLKFVSLRFANVYGPRQSPRGEAGVVAIFCDKMLSNKEATINGEGKQKRDFVFVKDVVEAKILAMQSNKVGFFNVGTAEETDINTIFKMIKEFINSSSKEVHGPANAGELQRSCLDFSKIKKDLGWQPKYNFKKGLEETTSWFKNKK